MIVGIYKITNLINGHAYIGQSRDIHRRWRNERSRAFIENSNDYNSLLSQAFRKYGLKNFSFEVIEECDVDKLDEREQYWIQFYDTYSNGYNRTLGGQSNLVLVEPNYVSAIRDELLFSDNSMPLIAQKYHVSLGTVGGINLGNTWYTPGLTYPLRNIHIKPERQYALMIGKDELVQLIYQYDGNISAVARALNTTRAALRRPIREYNLQDVIDKCREKPAPIMCDERVVDDLGNIFESPAAANKYYGSAHVREVCNGKRKTCNGHTFQWLKNVKTVDNND